MNKNATCSVIRRLIARPGPTLKSRLTACCAMLVMAAVSTAHAKTVIFTDSFTNSSTLNGTSTPGGTPDASSTSYDAASTKTSACSLIGNGLQMKLSSGTTAGYLEIQALFTSTPVQLVNVGDRINMTVVFTNSAGTLLAGGTNSLLTVGLYNSGGTAPVAGALASSGLGSGTTYASGYCQNWQGYVGQVNNLGYASSIITRPTQTSGTLNNGVQDLLFSNAGTGLYKFPAGTTVGTTSTSTVTLTTGATYTRSFTIALSATNQVTITDELYSGPVVSGVPLSSLVRTTSGGTTYTNFPNQYDGLAIGVANKGVSYNPTMDISKITITKLTSADDPALYNLQLNGFTNNTMSGAAQIGSAGDLWNNPDWAGVYTGSTNLLSGITMLDSGGTNRGVTVSMTSMFNNNTGDWNTGTFSHYTGQTAGSATAVLIDQVAKIDYSGMVNTITLSFSGLPTNTLVTAYVYGTGNSDGTGTKWSFAAANGGGVASTVANTAANPTDRNVTLASSKGYGWNSLSGTSDSSGNLTITADGNAGGSIWWQVYLNGLQLQVGGTAPTIYGLTNQTVEAGSTVVMNPLVTGNPTPTYQWQTNGIDIVGATNASLSLTNVTTDLSGYVYTLIAMNAVGAATNSMTLTVTVPVFSTMTITNVSPANGASAICYDTPLTFTFSDTVTLGTSGSIKIFAVTNGTLPIDTISASSGLVQQRTFPGDGQSFSYQTIQISGNTVKVYPHFNTLNSNQTYYVTIDPKTFKDSGGTNYVGLTDTNAWQFSTKSAPADPLNPAVNASGSGDFVTVQGAVNSIPSGNTTPTVIHISNGDYNEIVDIAGKNNVTFRGQSRNGVTVGFANNAAFQVANSGTTHARMAVKVNANDITFDTLTITNRTPQGGTQAEALMTESNAKRCTVNNSEIDSRQDTILANGSSQSTVYFNNSKIVGNFDYIWGGGACYFNNCVIHTISGTGGGNLTAARTDTSASQSSSFPWLNPFGTYTANGVSFVNCTFEADAGLGAITLAGSNGTSNNLVAWTACKFATNCTTPLSTLFNGNYLFWQNQNTDLTGTNAVSFSTLTTIGVTNNDPRLMAATNANTWLYGWTPALAPTITTQPANVTVTAGQTASLVAAATGIPDVLYQWLQNGTNAPYASANSATLVITNAQSTDASTFAVIASNSSGSVTSSVVSLTVIVPAPPVTDGSSLQRLGSGNIQFSFSGTQNASYRIWASTDISLTPITDTWTLVGSGTFGASPVTFTDSNATNYPQRYYIISSP